MNGTAAMVAIRSPCRGFTLIKEWQLINRLNDARSAKRKEERYLQLSYIDCATCGICSL